AATSASFNVPRKPALPPAPDLASCVIPFRSLPSCSLAMCLRARRTTFHKLGTLDCLSASLLQPERQFGRPQSDDVSIVEPLAAHTFIVDNDTIAIGAGQI